MDVVQVQFTAPSEAVADEVATTLLERRLVACAQRVGPIVSRYWWHGALELATEWLVVCKTTPDLADDVTSAVASAHPFDVPEVLVSPVVGGSDRYGEWVTSSVRR